MNEHRAICPQCRREVVYEPTYSATITCPACGFAFKRSIGPGPEDPRMLSDWNVLLKPLVKAMLILAACLAAGAMVVYAGCSILFRH